MPCRPKLCQRVAAQLSQPAPSSSGPHIWISDDLLSEAFNRYLSVSHATRRYGSHVPGPLEARRRSAKRRMGMTAVSVGGGLPPGGDFGALFDAGDTSTAWKWEAPGLKLGEPPPAPPQKVHSNRKPAIWDWGLKASKMAIPPELDAQVLDNEVDLIEASRISFEKLLFGIHDLPLIDNEQLNPMFDFLVSSADETGAHNTARFMRWLEGRVISQSVLHRLSGLVEDKLRLQTLPQDDLFEVLKMLPRLVSWQTDEMFAQQMHSIYEGFWRLVGGEMASNVNTCFAFLNVLGPTARDAKGIALVVEVLGSGLAHARTFTRSNFLMLKNLPAILKATASQGITEEERSQATSEIIKLLTQTKLNPKTLAKCTQVYLAIIEDRALRQSASLLWLKCLRECQYTDLHVDGAYAVLAEHFQPCDLAEHFSTLPALEFARLLLRVWLPNVRMNAFARENWGHDHEQPKKQPVVDQVEFATKTLPHLIEDFETLVEKSPKNVDRESTNHHPLQLLLRVFAERNLQYDGLSEAIIRTCIAAYRPQRLHVTFLALWFSNHIRLKTSSIVPIVEHLLAVGEAKRAVAIVYRVPSITPESYPQIYTKLVKVGLLWKTRAFYALHSKPRWVPPRKRRVYKLSITERHVDAVHLIAHAHASSGENIRVAYRSVWSCYRYLQDRGAQLSSLLSRSLVHAGITRPLQARLWIADQRMEFILRMVRRIEGDNVADEVEDIAKRTRQGIYDQITEKKKKEAARFVDKARKATMFRLKAWGKPKPDFAEEPKENQTDALLSHRAANNANAALHERLYKPFGSEDETSRLPETPDKDDKT